jgi:predicted ATPase/DNA-binding SARP family transcriptional activator
LPPAVPITYRAQYRRCGKAACSCCASGGAGHGPYWYAYWREGGRQRSRYLGKHPPPDGGAAPTQERRASADALRVRTLGAFAVWRGETLLPPAAWTSRRATALFKCLLGAPGHRLPREQAGELLWPEADPAAGAANLRTTLHLLRQVLDAPGAAHSYLRSEGAVLALAPGGGSPPPAGWLDATTFGHAAHTALAGHDVAACRAALAYYGGEYLPDDLYDAWATPLRESLHRQYVDLLLHLASLGGAQGELAEAEGCLRRVLATEPGHEEAAARLMGLLAAAGRRGAALRVYQALATALEVDLDLTPSTEIMALRARLLVQDAAPLAARVPPRQLQPAPLSNLPAPATSFVGRAWEMDEVRATLATSRLVTLIGPGGCGKTRLALEVAAGLVDTYPEGVWLVELAVLTDPTLVPRAVATTLGVAEQPDQPLSATLAHFLQPRQLLLVLDNCEHLLDACATLATTLLAACPHLRLLATSRERLEVPGERTHLVPSLTAPDRAHLPPLERLPAYEAVALFLARAQARRPELTLTAANAGAVVQICARLDGLPLAVELAAARVSALSVEGIAARLDDRFQLLTGGPRTALPRQQTLRAAVDWSYALLATEEQALLRRLAVFAGGWTLEGAEDVCAGGGVAAGAVLDLLAGLVHKSLVQLDERGGACRYGLLETIRQYARERLAESGETALMQRRHAAYCLTLAARAEQEITGPDQLRWLDLLEREHDNLRAALAWCLKRSEQAQGDEAALAVETGLRLAGGLHVFWRDRDHRREGLAWLDRALARGCAAPAAVRAQALLTAGVLAGSVGDLDRSQALLADSVTLCREAGDRRLLSVALSTVGWATAASGQEEQAAAALAESLALARAVGEPWLIAHALDHDILRVVYSAAIARAAERTRAWAAGEECLQLYQAAGNTMRVGVVQLHLGQIALYDGDYERARTAFVASLPMIRALGWRSTVAEGLVGLADVARKQGNYAEATALYTEALTLYRQLGDHQLPAFAAVLARLADVALEQGDWTAAQTHVAESLVIAWDTGQGDTPQLAGALEAQAVLAAVQGTPGRALRLAGAAAALQARLHRPVGASERATPHALVHLALTQHRLNRPVGASEQATLERRLAPARQALSLAEQATAWAAGQAMTPQQAIADALVGLPSAHGTPLRRATQQPPLTGA